jgi:hypothetical protein
LLPYNKPIPEEHESELGPFCKKAHSAGLTRQNCELKEAITCTGSGEELRSRGVEKGELPDSGVEFVYANLS